MPQLGKGGPWVGRGKEDAARRAELGDRAAKAEKMENDNSKKLNAIVVKGRANKAGHR